MYSVSFLPCARRDLEDTARYIARTLGNPGAALRTVEGIVAAANRLANMPYRRSVYVPLRPLPHEYRTIRSGNYVAFCWIEEEPQRVTVSRVLYAKANASARLAAAEREL